MATTKLDEHMIRSWNICALLCLSGLAHVSAQDAEQLLREGNTLYHKGDLSGAADTYSKAPADARATFNAGNALYRQEQVEGAQNAYESASTLSEDPLVQARAYHNLGNTHLSGKKYKEAISAYKNALLRNPNDADTRYNLAYAQKKLKEQEQQQKNEDKKEDENQDKDQKDQEQENKDKEQQDKEQEKKDQDQQQEQQDKGEQEKEEQGQEGKEQQQEQGEQQPRPEQISPQDAKRMLDALDRQEQDVQEKVRARMRPAQRINIEKDW